jgi:DNA polymerase III epsilon subunit family exonuclease
MGPFTVFDTETTGMSPTTDAIVEIAALRIDTDGERSTFQSLVNPLRPISYRAATVHGITDDMVANAPTFRDVAPEFLEFAKDSELVAHNARFDLAFLQESLNREGLPLWTGKTLDSIRIAKAAFPGLPSYSLQNLKATFGLGTDMDGPAHRAANDVEWTVEIFALAMQGIIDNTP